MPEEEVDTIETPRQTLTETVVAPADIPLEKAGTKPALDTEAALKAARNWAAREVFFLKDTKPLSEQDEFKASILDPTQRLGISEITSGQRSNTNEIVAGLRDSRGFFEPVMHQTVGAEHYFVPAVADKSYEDQVKEGQKTHVTMGDIGRHVILEEVVRDPSRPEGVLAIRYWVKSDDEVALREAGKVRDKDKNRLVRAPLVLKPINEDRAKELLKAEPADPKEKMRLLRLNDVIKADLGKVVVEDIPGYTKKPEAVGAQTPVIRVGDESFVKVTTTGQYAQTTYRSESGDKVMTKDALLDLRDQRRVGVVDREQTKVVWTVAETNLRSLPKADSELTGGEHQFTLKEVPSVENDISTDPARLEQAHYNAMVLANMEQLARDGVLSAKFSEEQNKTNFGATEQDKLENRAAYKVASNLRSIEGSRLMTLQVPNGAIEVTVTPLVTSDNKSVVVLSESTMKDGTFDTNISVRLVDRAQAEKWDTEYNDQQKNLNWSGEIVESLKKPPATGATLRGELTQFDNLTN